MVLTVIRRIFSTYSTHCFLDLLKPNDEFAFETHEENSVQMIARTYNAQKRLKLLFTVRFGYVYMNQQSVIWPIYCIFFRLLAYFKNFIFSLSVHPSPPQGGGRGSGFTHPPCQMGGTYNIQFLHAPVPIANELGWIMLFVGHAVALLIRSCHALTLCFKIWHLFSGLRCHTLL